MTELVINNNGRHGRDGACGFNGSSGGSHGGNGSHGGDGEDGDNAIPVHAHLYTDPTGIYVKYDHNTAFRMDMGNPLNKLIMSAVGGNGGHGGRGGNGGRGGDGHRGQDASKHSSGTNGGPGGDGGDGGCGGNGGCAGDGADVKVTVAERDMDVVMIMRQKVPHTHAGALGRGGAGGAGGSGGSGGPGGSSYSWTESHTEYYYENGQSRSRIHHTHHSTPGGHSGHPGMSGRSGHSGRDGRPGRDGDFYLKLVRETGAEETYKAPYDLAVIYNSHIDTTGYGIVEPASHVALTVSHENVGGMPTPSQQLIFAFVQNNAWVFCAAESRVALQRWIVQSQRVRIERPIMITITDVQTAVIGDPFNQTAHFEHVALVERVNQDFARVNKEKTPFVIQHVAQASVFKGATAIVLGEQAPLVFSVHNISPFLGIGAQNQQGPARQVAVTIRVFPKTVGGSSKAPEDLKHGDICVRGPNAAPFDDFTVGFQSQFPVLTPHEMQYVALTLEFTNVDLKPYTRVGLESTLHLGHVNDMMHSRPVQLRNFEVQLAEGYAYSSHSDVLIIANNRTEYDELVMWRKQIMKIGSRFSTWNVHLYSDLKLDHIRNDSRTLLQDFNCGTIIFLNNLCLKDEKLDQNTVDFVRPHELLVAARDHGINVLIFGSTRGIDIGSELVPAIHHPNIVLVKSHRKLVRGITKKLVRGEGDAIAVPANAQQADLCGFLKYKKKKVWCTLVIANKTLCYYKSETQQYPEGMVYLGNANISRSHNSKKDQTGFDIITLIKKKSFLEIPEREKGKTVPKNYGSVKRNFTEKANDWVEALARASNSIVPQRLDSEASPLMSSPYVEPPSSSSFSSPYNNGITIVREAPCYENNLKARGGIFNRYIKFHTVIDPNTKSLQFFKSKKSKSASKTLYLGRYTIINDTRMKMKDDTKFRIQTSDGILKVIALSVAEKETWISTLYAMVPPVPNVSHMLSNQNTHMKNNMLQYKLSGRVQQQQQLIETPKPEPQIQPTPHNTVLRVPIEERYMVFTPTPEDLHSKAKKLHKELSKRFPNQRYTVVYSFNPNYKHDTRGFCIRHIGHLDVHRSLDNTSPHIVSAVLPNDAACHNPEVINHPATLYALVKTQPFLRKLFQLNQHIDEQVPSINQVFSYVMDHATTVSVVVNAILSDVADELYHFHKPGFKSYLNTKLIMRRLITLDELGKFQFSSLRNIQSFEERIKSPAGEIAVEMIMHIKEMTRSFHSVWDTLLPLRRSTYVTRATNKLCDEIIKNWLFGGEHIGKREQKSSYKKFKKLVEEQIELRKGWWKDIAGERKIAGYKKYSKNDITSDKKLLKQHYITPTGLASGVTDSQVKTKKVLSHNEFVAYFAPARPDGVIEGQYQFSNDQQRTESINKFQKELSCPPGSESRSRIDVVPNIYPV